MIDKEIAQITNHVRFIFPPSHALFRLLYLATEEVNAPRQGG
jgi:hypothetical protein